MSKIKSVCFTENNNFAYSVREYCKCLGLDVDYINDISELMAFINTSTQGIIIVDSAYQKAITLPWIFCNNTFDKHFEFIFLEDNKKFENGVMKSKNITTLVNLDIVLSKIYTGMHNAMQIPKNEAFAMVSDLLDKFRFPMNCEGYKFAKECILIGMNSDETVHNYSKNFYPRVASTYSTTPENVEKAIRTAINKIKKDSPEVFDVDGLKGRKVTCVILLEYLIQLQKKMYFLAHSN